jgi:predicted nucleotidyltransferase
MLDIDNNRLEIAEICQELGVIRLDLFGSATRDTFGPESDVDVVVRFDRTRGEMFRRYFDLKEHLEALWNLPVDVVVEDAIKNPYFRKAVESSRVPIYEA